MRSIGVRELKARTSSVLRQVQDTGEPVEVTVRGRAVARLIPIEPPRAAAEDVWTVWADLDSVAAEIGARWPADITAAQAVREGRREL